MKQPSASLPFSTAEFRTRLSAVREKMARLGADTLLLHSPENTYYLTGFRTLGYSIYQALVVPVSGEPAFVTRKLEAGSSVPGTSNVRDAIGYDDTESPLDVLRGVLQDRGLLKGVIGIDESSRNLTSFQHRTLRQLCRPARFVDCSGLVESLRLVKSPAELDCVRRAAAATVAAMRAGARSARPGASENDVAAQVYGALIRGGSEYPGYPPFVCSGARTALAHASWEGRRIRRGDPVLVEVSGSVLRYHAPMGRTLVMGRPSREMSRALDAVQRALDRAIETMRPGVPSGTVHRAAYHTIEAAGLGRFFDRNTGYSVGIAFPPTWSEARTVPHYGRRSRLSRIGVDGRRFYLSRDNRTPLEPGMVFHVIPGVLVPDAFNVVVSATVAVTSGGAEVLTRLPRTGREH
jgi:Xaa-Pro dipeptidase